MSDVESPDTETAPAVPLERAHELDQISNVPGESASGRGRLLIAEGPSGIGKSTLLSEARDLARSRGMAVLHARGSQLERDYAFGLVLRLFEDRFVRVGAAQRRKSLRGRAALAGRCCRSRATPGSTPRRPTSSPSSTACTGVW